MYTPPVPPTGRVARGITLIELTVVIVVMLTLISVLFMAGRAYKEGADRANCILNIRTVQQSVRSWQNVNNVPADGVTAIDEDEVYGDGKFLPVRPSCPANGSYTFAVAVPVVGSLVVDCDIDGHEPEDSVGW
ncbi:type II secretion system protein [Persicirhabdus sediminis]|uniref:Type II secretion system protein n=1 Tax=Persicirhabdus sediminis TaxID=454144 RepID=A0A8J7MFV9_9BACT|nr:type II secretion system protein [Persicirhabdus sediminis]MBK1792037.1 type II secretion system protein [Persicirhabdus sediminis]